MTSLVTAKAVKPLEGVFRKVAKLMVDPMSVSKEMPEKKERRFWQDKEEPGVTEIDNNLMKIAYLMAIGYGDAGVNIIIHVLESTTGIDTELPGEKILGVFGFCDIRNFTDATEVL